ncbi:RNA polymerase sigma-70 factor (ECF subfamily) [Ruminiclostridium sufflavum DSM 19573]|uniref:RNA polymerase sigma-70 factor (ECF subfamily) n=1 Tax=Ruminiclostridium sufflavum DSM 19573 TaxID=1121337 RepID=A0A318XIF1_9FIRM|nr:sigma-70 family RNA polymerase sigma factor [Ruminiclostridium sufflavum]PYG87000.1 RNA polymerase sigma-70 factor (ECF subfamily) [Ruminiclostridium sufflavum DSM 19573]
MKKDAFGELYCLYFKQVYLYAYSLCRNHHMAEDLTNDTFYKAMLALDKEVPSTKYWLLRVCRNLFFDFCRKNRDKILPLEDALLSRDEDPLEKLLQDEKHRRLYRAMQALSQWDRELLTMFYYGECSIHWISDFTGHSPGAVKTALSRARSRLKNLMQEE